MQIICDAPLSFKQFLTETDRAVWIVISILRQYLDDEISVLKFVFIVYFKYLKKETQLLSCHFSEWIFKNSIKLETLRTFGNFLHFYGMQFEANIDKILHHLTLLHANIKGADQTALPRSLISAFVFRSMESIVFHANFQ